MRLQLFGDQTLLGFMHSSPIYVSSAGMPIAFHSGVEPNETKSPGKGPNRIWNTMGYYRAIDREDLTGSIFSNSLVSRYAWLEHERGIWHFLTDLFAGPEESTRRWSNKQHALNELIKEGWTIVGSYPESPSTPQPECGGSRGYGLMRVGY